MQVQIISEPGSKLYACKIASNPVLTDNESIIFSLAGSLTTILSIPYARAILS